MAHYPSTPPGGTALPELAAPTVWPVRVLAVTEACARRLLPVLPAGPGVCDVCRAGVPPGYCRCLACTAAVARLGERAADVVLPVAVAVKGGWLAGELWRYKAAGRAAGPARLTLTALLWRFLAGHEGCLAAATGVDGFQTVTAVPGRRRGTAGHPLHGVLGTVGPATGRYRCCLQRCGGRLAVVSRVRGQAVLVVDDTWTTGTSSQQAAAALKQAGARRVAVVVLGRHMRSGHPGNDAYLRRAAAMPFTWSTCAVSPVAGGGRPTAAGAAPR